MTESPPPPTAPVALPPPPTAQEVQQQADEARRRFDMELQQRYLDLWRFMGTASGSISVEERRLYALLQQCYMDRRTPGDCQATVFGALMCPHCRRNIKDVLQRNIGSGGSGSARSRSRSRRRVPQPGTPECCWSRV